MKLELALKAAVSQKTRWIPWVLGLVLVAKFGLRDLLTEKHGVIDQSVFWGRDFINVWTGGQLVRHGRLDILYDPEAYSAYQQILFGHIRPHNYSYPPITFPLAAAFSLLPYWLSLTVWLAGTGALFVHACRKWWPKAAGTVWLALLTPAATMNIWSGHYGFIMGALFLYGWTSLDRRPWRAGMAFGLMLIKPHLACLIPVALLIRRDWTALLSGAATVAALIAGTTAIYGWQPWHDFMFRTSGVQASMIDAGDNFFGLMSCSSATMVLRWVDSWPLALAVQGLVSGGAIAAVVLAAWRRLETRDLAFVVATATFLVLPYSFSYDLTVVSVGALTILSRDDAPKLERRLALYGFLSAQLGIILAALNLPGLPIMLGGLLFAQLRLALGTKQQPAFQSC